MPNFFKTFFIMNIKFLLIYSITFCNKQTYLPPETEYHCSGLEINQDLNKGDKYCCLWIFTDEVENKTITRCSSIRQDQFDNLDQYIAKKTNISNSNPYKDLIIKCLADQRLYCSNVVLDEDDIPDCSKLGISFEGDKFCCRWNYKDSSTRNKKVNDYCASINEYEYLTINSYISYKNNAPDQRYDDLTIDCLGTSFKINKILYFFYLFLFLK